ncbi:MAG: hypothetical protein QOJ66_1503 [Ilumatobacteraceae bacterium]|jgi:hypothetical protein
MSDEPFSFGPPAEADARLWTATAPAPVRRFVRLPQGNEMLGIIYGLVVAAVSGGIWYLVVTATKYQVVYLAVAMGVLVGKAVSYGSGRSRVLNACFSVVIALVGMFASYYFIDRHVLIRELGSDARVPLWDSFRFARALISAGFDANPSGKLFTLIAAVLAGFVGYKETSAKLA